MIVVSYQRISEKCDSVIHSNSNSGLKGLYFMQGFKTLCSHNIRFSAQFSYVQAFCTMTAREVLHTQMNALTTNACILTTHLVVDQTLLALVARVLDVCVLICGQRLCSFAHTAHKLDLLLGERVLGELSLSEQRLDVVFREAVHLRTDRLSERQFESERESQPASRNFQG